MRLVLWFLILVVAQRSAWADDPLFSSDEFQEIEKITKRIEKICPPKDCIVVGIGRSPGLFIANLQDDFSNYAYSLPLSSFRYNPNFTEMGQLSTKEKALISKLRPLDVSQENRLQQHFREFLPGLSGTKRVLVIDYAQSGYSLFAAQKYLERFLAAENPAVQVESFAIVQSGQSNQVRGMAPRYGVGIDSFHHEELTPGELDNALKHRSYGNMAEYPHPFDITKPEKIAPSKYFANLKSEFHLLKSEERHRSNKTCLANKLSELSQSMP